MGECGWGLEAYDFVREGFWSLEVSRAGLIGTRGLIMQLEFVGDLSISDAERLFSLGQESTHILEFGVGGSTQIFAQCNPIKLVCIETDPAWVTKTQSNLQRISHKNWTAPAFVPYDLFKHEGRFDLIFVDGAPEKRLDFAMRAWPILDTGGKMVFHDTKRFEYFREAAWVIQSFFNEVSRVDVNVDGSNLTIIEKGPFQSYENWNLNERKPMWAYGNGEIPEGEGLWKMES